MLASSLQGSELQRVDNQWWNRVFLSTKPNPLNLFLQRSFSIHRLDG
jgi:hypothetical protein